MFNNTLILDFETSGLNPYHDEIIEIAAKKFRSEDKYSTLIKHTKPLDKKIVEITNITDDMLLKEGVSQRVAFHDFGEFIKSSFNLDKPLYILAHNGNSFDFIFMKKILSTLEFTINLRYIDTISVSKFVNPRLFSHKLATLCHPNIYNIANTNAHRAMSDVLTTEKIFEKMIYHRFSSIEEVYNKIEFL
jgi:DNA polymerase III alpha subunit (gram-positive type)